jgi:hypothetical protein
MTETTCQILPRIPIYIRRNSQPHEACRHTARHVRILAIPPDCHASTADAETYTRDLRDALADLAALYAAPWEPDLAAADQAEAEALAAYLTDAYAEAPNTVHRGSLPP